MTTITASNSTVGTLMSAKPQALSGLTAASRVAPVAPVAPAAALSDSKGTAASPATSTPSLSLGTILTLQDARAGGLTKETVTRAINGYGANTPTLQDTTATGPDLAKPAAATARFTMADLNGEGANLVNLQTRTPTGPATLSLANQSPQSLLKLMWA